MVLVYSMIFSCVMLIPCRWNSKRMSPASASIGRMVFSINAPNGLISFKDSNEFPLLKDAVFLVFIPDFRASKTSKHDAVSNIPLVPALSSP